MNYLKLIFDLQDRYHEQFIAELMDLDFYGFEQFDDKLIAYVEKPRYNDSNKERIEQLITIYPDASFSEIEDIEDQNWNETWEKTIQPQRIGTFLVKPTWSDEQPGPGEILLEIDPKMSFGTGYHATTRLMLRELESINFKGKNVLDAGTGTGILAIAAAKLGAGNVIGFDNDPLCELNSKENILINRTEKTVEIRLGGLEQIREDERFDILLANINRNVILEMLPKLINCTEESGVICLTGLLDSDENVIRSRLAGVPVEITGFEQEDEWILFHLIKQGK